jgi:hypothetical protein
VRQFDLTQSFWLLWICHDLSTLITDQQFVDELNSLIEAQWQRLFGLFTISID